MTILRPAWPTSLRDEYTISDWVHVMPPQRLQTAVRFDGTNEKYLAITSSPLDYNSAYTVCLWVYPYSGGIGYTSPWTIGHDATTQSVEVVQIEWTGTTWILYCEVHGGSNDLAYGPSVNLNAWQHLAIRRTGASNVELYFNGSYVDNATTSIGARGASDHSYLGLTAYQSDLSEYFDGRIAYAAAWQTALSADQIRQQMYMAAPVQAEDLYGWWPLGSGLYKRSRDLSGNGHHWTESGMPTEEIGPPLRHDFVANRWLDERHRTHYWPGVSLPSTPIQGIPTTEPGYEPFQVNRQSLQAKGLDIWYPSRQPLAGSTLTEKMAGGHGTLLSNVDWVHHPEIGWGVHCETDTNDYVDLNHTTFPIIDIGTRFSISLWAVCNSATNWSAMFGIGSDNENYIILYWRTGSTNLCGGYLAQDAVTNYVQFDHTETPGKLEHFVFTYDYSRPSPARWVAYIDGQVANPDSNSSGAASGVLSVTGAALLNGIVESYPSWDEPFRGSVYDFRFYNRLLGPAEVAQIYDKRTRFDLFTQLLLWGEQVEAEAGGEVPRQAMHYARLRRAA